MDSSTDKETRRASHVWGSLPSKLCQAFLVFFSADLASGIPHIEDLNRSILPEAISRQRTADYQPEAQDDQSNGEEDHEWCARPEPMGMSRENLLADAYCVCSNSHDRRKSSKVRAGLPPRSA